MSVGRGAWDMGQKRRDAASTLGLTWCGRPALVPCGCAKAHWELVAPFLYSCRGDGIFVPRRIPAGYVTDGASIPLWARYLTPQSGDTWPAALVHDALYATRGFCGMYSRKEADLLFRDGLLRAGVPRWRAWAMYWAVRIGGRRGWLDVSDTDRANMAQPWWDDFKKGNT